ncbi:hypothetical protein SDJN03_04089, partial [Cucurbita argyrosperma subsp. sororia]
MSSLKGETIIVMHGLVDSDPCGWTPHESCVVTIDLPACDCLPSDQQMTRQASFLTRSFSLKNFGYGKDERPLINFWLMI